jgi:pantoate--beta-alanine ligase
MKACPAREFFMAPRIVTTIEEIRRTVAAARQRGLTVGFVPTMGALHAGHASLIRQARQQTGYVVVSIFVNPTQFGPAEDFSRYPRPFERDLALCADEQVDVIFHPTPESMYPPGFRTFIEVTGLDDVLEGKSRPGHFRGVATVVMKLFHQVAPDIAYFGQKDAQQVRVLERMVRDLDVPVRLHVCATIREPDGLAMSSRNQYLDSQHRKDAAVLYEVLQEIRRRIEAGERRAGPLLEMAAKRIAAVLSARIDYAAIVDADSLEPIDPVVGQILVVLAVFIGGVRLIDNMQLEVPLTNP